MDSYLRALRNLMVWGFVIGVVLVLGAGLADSQSAAIGYEPEMSDYAALATGLSIWGGAITCLAVVALMAWLACKSIGIGQARILALLSTDPTTHDPS